MGINAEELMRRYELLDQEPVLEYSSLETEADNENPPSTLSTPSTITDTDLSSPLLLFTPELDKSFSFDLQDILDLSTEEEKAELTGTSSSHINNSNSHNSSIEGIETTEDSSFDPDSLLNKEKKNPQKFTLQKVLSPEPTQKEDPNKTEETKSTPSMSRQSPRKCSRKPRNPTPIPGRKDFKIPKTTSLRPRPQPQIQPPMVTHFVSIPQAPIVAYNPACPHHSPPCPYYTFQCSPHQDLHHDISNSTNRHFKSNRLRVSTG